MVRPFRWQFGRRTAGRPRGRPAVLHEVQEDRMTNAINSTRLYLRTPEAQFARLLWVRNHRPNEMLLGFYGLEGRRPRITHEFPERIIGPTESGPFKIKWEDASPVAIELDHFSCHADGRFHLKQHGGDVFYSHNERHSEPLGPGTGIFLNLIVASDRAAAYQAIKGEPKLPHVWVDGGVDRSVVLRCLFSGGNFPIEPEVLAVAIGRPQGAGVIVLNSATLKGAVVASPFTLPEDAHIAKPPGTLLVFQWPRGAARSGVKSFILR